MSSIVQTAESSKGATVGGYVLSGLPVIFLLLDGVMKLFKPAFVVDATTKLGYQESTIVPLGIVLVVCTLIYLFPATSVLGAILLTGYLGGAVATHVRMAEGAFPIGLKCSLLEQWIPFTQAEFADQHRLLPAGVDDDFR